MGLAQVMEHRRAKKKFSVARRWMEEKFDTLSTSDQGKFLKNFQQVCDDYDNAWVALSNAERDNEKQRNQPRAALLAEKERAQQEIPF